MAKDAWRTPSQTHRDYLNQLVTWGYVPSEVEQIIIDSDKPALEADETTDTEETAA
jgi:ParB family chromosome partitioning protein